MTPGAGAYDAIAPHFRELAAARTRYLDAVDDFVVRRAPLASALLDVGAGDGERAVALARRIDARRLVLAEPSAAMAAMCRKHAGVEVWEMAAEVLSPGTERFDVVTCLWNVLGHLDGESARVAALTRMREALAPGGSLFFDVNNRHNAHAYGRWRVLGRRMLDALAPDQRRGDTRFEWAIGGLRIAATGHVFTPREVDRLLDRAELEIRERVSIDYVSGALSPSVHDGQLVYHVGVRRASA